MINRIHIVNYKGLAEAELDLKKYTILTGLNSTGKSTCFQSILAALYLSKPNAGILLSDWDFSFESIRNRNVNAKSIKIEIDTEDGEIKCIIDENGIDINHDTELDIETNLYYLNANRLGFGDFETMSPKFYIGLAGEYIFGTFEKEKSNTVITGLRCLDESETLSSHVNYWLSYISGLRFELQTEIVSTTKVKVIYRSEGLPNIVPQQLGVGISYLAKILIMCLRAKVGDVLMIENPEIHLHPAAQARLGEFFTYISNAGIQLLIETHCEYLIDKLQYQIYKAKFNSNDAVLYYKGGPETPFEQMIFESNGRFAKRFPSGFYDVTLDELLEME